MPRKTREAPDAAQPNAHRGELAVTLLDKGIATEFVMRPDFEAVAAIDAQLGSVVQLMQRAVRDPSSLDFDELAVIIAEGIKAHGRKVKDSNAHVGTPKIKKMIFDTGIFTVVPAAVAFLAAAVTGGAKEPAPGKE